MILAFATVKRPSDLNLLRITPGAMQVTEGSGTFQLVFGAINARTNHPHGPTITLRQIENECLCPMRLIKEYITKTKDREDWSDKLFVTRKMGPAVAVSNGTVTSWLKETLTLTNIRTSGGSTWKVLSPMHPAKEPQLGQSWKLVTGLTLPQCMGTTQDACLKRF